MFFTIGVNILLLFYLFSTKKKLHYTYQKFITGLFYIGGGCIFLTMIPYKDNEFAKFLIMGIFVLIWINDSFAYLVGRSIGRTKLFPRVSPKKTVEGAVGGLVATLVAAYFLAQYVPILTLVSWIIIALLVVVFGVLGDLIESKFKREAKVKDSSNFIPGHGGFLDRLDSIIFAAPFVYVYLHLFY